METSFDDAYYWISCCDLDYKYPKYEETLAISEQEFEIQFQHWENSNFQIIIRFPSYQKLVSFEIGIKPYSSKLTSIEEENYTYIKSISSKAQQSIDLYSYNESSIFEPGLFAVKRYDLSNLKSRNTSLMAVRNEIKIHSELIFCENVARIEQIFKNENSYQLVMDYTTEGTLRDFIIQQKSISEVEIREIMQQLLLTIDLLHKQNIIHRDLNPDNVLFFNKEDTILKIGQLGNACKSNDQEQIILKSGTPGYIDPEVLNGNKFRKKSDIFSLGCVLYNLITRTQLFSGRDASIVLSNNKYLDPLPLIDINCNNVSEECKDLLIKMLERVQSIRINVEGCLKHSWFSLEKEKIKNFLSLNRYASKISLSNELQVHSQYSTPKFSLGMSNKFFDQPLMYQGSQKYSAQPQNSNQLNTPLTKNIDYQQSLQSFKIKYNEDIFKNLTSQKFKNKKKEDSQDNFTNSITQFGGAKLKKLMSLKYRKSLKETCKLQQVDEGLEDFLVMDYQLSNTNIDEISYEHEINDKIQMRIQINDVIAIPSKCLSIKNSRRSSIT